MKIKELFAIDSRSLVLFRIALALVLLYDVTTRAVDLTAFYTDSGVLPRAALLSRGNNPFIFSFHLMSGTIEIQRILFLLQGMCAVGLLLGWRTRWMILGSWLLLISVQDRNPLVFMAGADTYLRLLLFWSLFLPLGKYLSIDAARDPKPQNRPAYHLSLGSIAILLQCALVYFVTGIHKANTGLWQSGDAVSYILSNEIFTKPAAQLLLQSTELTRLLTYGVLGFELLAPLLLFFPVCRSQMRTIVIFGFLFMHLSFYLCMRIDIYQLVSVAAMFLFLPSCFWDRLFPGSSERAYASPEPGPEIAGAAVTRSAQKLRPAVLKDMVIIFFFSCVVFWNIAEIMPQRYQMPRALSDICRLAHLDQTWKMFVDQLPPGGWFVAAGKLGNGKQVDLSREGAPLAWGKPAVIWTDFRTERWRKYLFRLIRDSRTPPEYARYLCRSWNKDHRAGERLNSLEIVYLFKAADDNNAGPYGKKGILQYNCSVPPRGKP